MDVSSTGVSGRAASSARGPHRRRLGHALPRGPLVEALVVLAGVAAYFGARGLTESDPQTAVENAHGVVAFEKALGLYHEPTLQRLVLGNDPVLDALNWVYIWGHWPVIALVLLWMLRRHPRQYVVLRNALVISGLIGVVVFVLYPVAPPRLAGLGLFDSVSERSSAYRVLQPPAFVNQYAAIPSLHVGWDLLMGLTLVRYGRWMVVRAIGVLLPAAMIASVVLTANHYLIDGVLGALVALVGLVVAQRLQDRRALSATVPAERPAPPPVVAPPAATPSPVTATPSPVSAPRPVGAVPRQSDRSSTAWGAAAAAAARRSALAAQRAADEPGPEESARERGHCRA